MEAHLFARENRLIGPTMEQPQYNMFHREKFEVEYKQLYKNFGMGTTIWSPLASGVLTDKYLNQFPEGTRLSMKGLEWLKKDALTEERLDKVRGLNKIALELGTSMPLLALAWCLKNQNVSTVILGASKVHHLEENLKALDVEKQLTDEVMAKIETVLGNAPQHPMW
jgi:aryl-alcohol dehydrogenase-like predicted oxidoreductase